MAEITLNTDAPQPTLEEQSAAQDAAAAEKAKAGAPEGTTPGRPDWLPENFKSVEDFVKSQKDSRAEVTRLQQELATLKKGTEATPNDPALPPADPSEPAKTAEELAAATPAEQNKAAQDAVKAAGVDITPFQDEFNRTGDVSTENRAKLAEALKGQFGDASKALVDQFIQGQQASRTNFRNAGLNEAGGAEQYAAMTAWAKDNMSMGEIEAYNRAVDSGDVNAATLAIRGLRQTFEAKNGRAPTLNRGNNAAPGAGADAPFKSAFEQSEAINDPRYAKDDAYRASVVRRMIASRL